MQYIRHLFETNVNMFSMSMIDPHLIFQNPEKYWDYILQNLEGQYFDRKEIRKDNTSQIDKARNSIIETVSAFTNSRGGVIIVGISDEGVSVGLNHLSESEYNSLPQSIIDKLINHQAMFNELTKDEKRFLLIYAPQGQIGVCKIAAHKDSKGWIRSGANNLPLTQVDEVRLLNERNHSFEQLSRSDFDILLIERDVLRVFKKNYLEEQNATYNDEDVEFLKRIVAVKTQNEKLVITNAGMLFFGSNPVGYIPAARVRILKYSCEYKDFKTRGNPVFDRDYDGALPILLQKIRTFIREGAFFKTYTYRNPDSNGIIDEPEFPPNVIEEAIVNAIIHRDYNTPVPIECSLFKDAFVVRNPGGLLQPRFIPTKFSLEEQDLYSYSRNPAIVQWSKTMKDESGQRFVKALSEGSRTMRDSMKTLGLPSPVYETNGFTQVILYNNYEEREARIKKLQQPAADEFTNLFPINLEYKILSEPNGQEKTLQTELLSLVKDKLQNIGWFIDRDRSSRITAHRKGQHVKLNDKINQWIRIFPAYTFQIYHFAKEYYLSIDFDIQLKNSATLDKLYNRGIKDLRYRSAQVYIGGTWTHATIQDSTEYYTRVILPEFDRTEEVATNDVIPSLSKIEIGRLVQSVDSYFNLDAKIKELSLASLANASKERSEKIIQTASYIAKEIFPLSYNGFTAYMKSTPVPLMNEVFEIPVPFTVIDSLKEPQVKFADNTTDANILSGLSKFGSFSSPNRDIDIVPFCITGFEKNMQNLIDAIRQGSMNFKGIERTFKVSIKNLPVISKGDANEFLEECKRLVETYNWEGDVSLKRIFLIHIPEDKYPITDFTSPYYSLKEFLLEKGIPVQMVDTPTLTNPRFKDFNLALNIVAKIGDTPWVLPNALPDVDLFIGLSYAQYKSDEQLYRTMGYANVFSRYGEWQYYKGNSESFNYEEKHIYLAQLVKETLEQMNSLPNAPSIHIHFSSKFSRKDRDYIFEAAQKVRANVQIHFVWINSGHNIRMFDNRIEGNGSLSRGSYVIMGKNQFFLSTTGYSTLKKTLGTPIMLEVNVTTVPYNNQVIPYQIIAQHILSLTKLNWASTQSINGEPVTTKYAHDIARLSQVFFRLKGEFKLNKVLERTPWFI